MKSLGCAIIVSIVLVSCHRDIGEMPKDFNFIYQSDFDCLNTVDSTFTLQGVGTSKGSIEDTVIKVILTKAEKEAVYRVMMENDVMDMPQDFNGNPNGYGGISDMREDHLTVRVNNITKNIMYYYGYI